MLSGEAQVDSKPQLEIHADDVKCTHGATIGQIDRDALFYLRSRGLSEAAARSLLVYAFASESLAQVEIESLRRRLQRELADRLPQGEFLEALS
jgi:Fe-S cluster assembly protein SufD